MIVPASTLVGATLAVPNFTDVAPVKFEPVIVTVVPPPAGPLLGDTPVTTGAGAPTTEIEAIL